MTALIPELRDHLAKLRARAGHTYIRGEDPNDIWVKAARRLAPYRDAMLNAQTAEEFATAHAALLNKAGLR